MIITSEEQSRYFFKTITEQEVKGYGLEYYKKWQEYQKEKTLNNKAGGGSDEKQLNNIKNKLIEMEIRNFTDAEIDRVFKNVISPTAARRGLEILINEGLTIENLYQTENNNINNLKKELEENKKATHEAIDNQDQKKLNQLFIEYDYIFNNLLMAQQAEALRK